jgi:D-beta-D-heptose 7-phosphate kinase/D-beta-D-heptose 1-phosphate adenosyltransferase
MTEQNTQQPKSYKILLIGDDCVDVYQYGTVDRISPEAPVPVFKFSGEEQRPGMAGNVAANLRALGCTVDYLHSETSTKTRLIDSRSKQHIVRIDNDARATAITLETAIPALYDAVVISDYDKGTVSYELIEEIIVESQHGTKFPVFVDTKKTDLERFQGAWVKINELEYSKIKSECSGLIVTRGASGARVVYHELEFAAPTVEVADVTGAGDTFLAALVSEYLTRRDIAVAIPYAIRAASITVQKLGVYAPSWKELE